MNRGLIIIIFALVVFGSVAIAMLTLSGDGPSEKALLVWGGRGTRPGQFVMPRAITVVGEYLFVVDKRARIQRFSLDGKHQIEWQTPAFDKGKPTGLGTDLEGNLLVADTHYSRILRYAVDGRLLDSFGVEGKGPGQFIYPTDVTCDAEGNLYVCEYGGNDRVQKFDAKGRFILQWGCFGEAPGEFQRPMSVAVGDDGLIYVADSCNHRVQVFDANGNLVRAWGKVGGGPGQLRYPYDLAVDDGNIIVCEYGNSRLQRFSADGKFLAKWGSLGVQSGQLNAPWGVFSDLRGRIYVADAGNNQVQVVRF